jgi:hypothetical protein
MKVKLVGTMLLLLAASAGAQQAPGDLFGFLPVSGEVAGWKLSGKPKNYRGDQLFQMINGGAGIYHEYGFRQALSAEYVDENGKSISLEIYEMKSPASAYGIYTFKIGADGKALSIGQEAMFQDYYLNFWKGNLLVTVIGRDSEERTIQGVVGLAKAVDARITNTGERPDLANLLLRQPLGFSHPKYVRGPLGMMNSGLFDADTISRFREGMIGGVGDCQVFVFRCADNGESAKAFNQITSSLNNDPKFMNQALNGHQYSTVGPEKELVVIDQTGRYISIVIGNNKDKVTSVSNRLIEKLKSG